MNAKDIHISQYQYSLPDDKIAKHPLAVRDSCKLLVADSNGVTVDTVFTDLPTLLPPDTMLVYNNTRVINARIRMQKPTGAAIELFCLEPIAPADYERNFAATETVTWKCLVGNSKRWKDGTLTTTIGDNVTLTATRLSKDANGESVVRLTWDNPAMTFSQVIEAAGVIPIPPYLNRDTEATDSHDYQTVFSRIQGSVAAPTAGLHFTDTLLQEIDKRGIKRREVTLHVGAGTFRPVQTESIGDHDMHSELIVVDKTFITELASQQTVYAVGTTSVRTLESLYHIGCLISQNKWDGEVPQWYAYSADHPNLTVQQSLMSLVNYLNANGLDKIVASTRIIIAPGYTYRIVKGMVTNFHQPGSTLLLLVSAMIGDTWRDVYRHALDNDYRFLSYGDACLFSQL